MERDGSLICEAPPRLSGASRENPLNAEGAFAEFPPASEGAWPAGAASVAAAHDHHRCGSGSGSRAHARAPAPRPRQQRGGRHTAPIRPGCRASGGTAGRSAGARPAPPARVTRARPHPTLLNTRWSSALGGTGHTNAELHFPLLRSPFLSSLSCSFFFSFSFLLPSFSIGQKKVKRLHMTISQYT